VSQLSGDKRSLAAKIGESLRHAIQAGEFEPGSKLPSEAQLTERHGVSRTVVREALSALRADGLVEPRQGAGVFVLDAVGQGAWGNPVVVDRARISSTVELLELRTPVEVEAAGLAAIRRSPAQEELIFQRHAHILQCVESRKSIRDADFALHLEIARATNNPRFEEFLKVHGVSVIPQSEIVTQAREAAEQRYMAQLMDEHEKIVLAISNRDEKGAREAMHAHLVGSQARHRELLRTLGHGR
jgi:GntR family transcriptional repressor for pyruvate dehydrogenase complex